MLTRNFSGHFSSDQQDVSKEMPHISPCGWGWKILFDEEGFLWLQMRPLDNYPFLQFLSYPS